MNYTKILLSAGLAVCMYGSNAGAIDLNTINGTQLAQGELTIANNITATEGSKIIIQGPAGYVHSSVDTTARTVSGPTSVIVQMAPETAAGILATDLGYHVEGGYVIPGVTADENNYQLFAGQINDTDIDGTQITKPAEINGYLNANAAAIGSGKTLYTTLAAYKANCNVFDDGTDITVEERVLNIDGTNTVQSNLATDGTIATLGSGSETAQTIAANIKSLSTGKQVTIKIYGDVTTGTTLTGTNEFAGPINLAQGIVKFEGDQTFKAPVTGTALDNAVFGNGNLTFIGVDTLPARNITMASEKTIIIGDGTTATRSEIASGKTLNASVTGLTVKANAILVVKRGGKLEM